MPPPASPWRWTRAIASAAAIPRSTSSPAPSVAEEQALDGRRLLESLVAGYEIGSRVGGATTLRANVHSHGTWGSIATAVAVARLADAPPQTIREVINLAASMSPANSWTPALEGATIRNLYPGRSGLQGILAVELQRCGFTGLRDAPSDVYATVLGDRFDGALAVAGLDALGRGERYRIEQNYFKLHACCRFNHFALDAVLALRRANSFDADDVVRLRVTTIPFGARMADREPTNTLAAKFSIPYSVAAALVLDRTDHAAFGPSAIRGSARSRAGSRSAPIPRCHRAGPTIPPRTCGSRCATGGCWRTRQPWPAETPRTPCGPRSSWPNSSGSPRPCSVPRRPAGWSTERTPSRR